jgi:hypothetical protein
MFPPARSLLVGVVTLAVGLTAEPGRAQETCPDGRITRVFVDNHSIFDPQEVAGAPLQWVYSLANTLHVRTKASFVRREILLSVGDCYDAFLVQDSERLLRRYSFIAQVEVYGIRQETGDWHLIVDTQDEWTTKIEARLDPERGFRLARVEVKEENFLGRGMLLGVFWQERDANRARGVQMGTPRLFNTRTDGALRIGETRAGSFVRQELFNPFVGEVGRFAWRQFMLRSTDYFAYATGALTGRTHVLLPLEDRRFELTAVGRVGEPGGLTIFGAGVSRTTLGFGSFPGGVEEVVDRDFGNSVEAPPEVADLLAPQTRYRAATRINLLLGQRNIRFEQRRGLDALRGLQDVELGSEIALTVGRTLVAGGRRGEPDDLYTRFRLYAAGTPGSFVVMSNIAFEGRQIFASETEPGGWRDLMAEVDVLAYWQPPAAPRHTFVGRATGAGGWALDQPFQLTLGGAQGVRGYQDWDFPGARRLVLSGEDRIYFGWPYPETVDLGATLFADIGRTWAGPVPFGVDSGWRGTVGAGLRIGFPAGSRQVIRLDAGVPFGGGRGFGDLVFRVSFGDLLGFTTGLEDLQLARSRRMTVGTDRFSPIRIQP